MAPTANPFTAAASALGYAYQFRRSLFRAWTELGTSVDWQIAVEAGDDVEFRGKTGTTYEQLKHRAPGALLRNSDDDLWKSLRVWLEIFAQGQLEPGRSRLSLITTATAGTNNIAEWLGDTAARDPARALDKLDNVATTSKSKSKARLKAHKLWMGLTKGQKTDFLRAVTIYTAEPDIHDIGEGLRTLANYAARREQADAFLEMLEGWWFQRCLTLMAAPGTFILGEEIDNYISKLRERFANPEDLPVDIQIELAPAADRDLYANEIYVHQLKLANVGPSRVQSAVNDYLRAFAQRSQWLRQGLLFPEELNLYEHRLEEEWRLVFDRTTDELEPDDTEAERIRAAKEVYRWAEEALAPSIRTSCTEAFIVRGSLHMLSDERRVGWHPDFMMRLVGLLEPAEAK